MFDKLLRIAASIAIVRPYKALLWGGQAFRVPRGQDITGKELEKELRRRGISILDGMFVDGIRNEIRFAVPPVRADAVARILNDLNLEWW